MSAHVTGPPPTAEYLAANKGPQTLVLVILFPTLALIIVGLRLYTRFSIVRSPSHEDFAIALAMVDISRTSYRSCADRGVRSSVLAAQSVKQFVSEHMLPIGPLLKLSQRFKMARDGI